MLDRAPHVGIVGGGMLGTTLAYRLAQRGLRVTLVEARGNVGGLAGSMQLGPHTVDRYYHVISPSDSRMLATAAELGLAGEVRFASTRVGVYLDGKLYPFDGLGDLARFRPFTALQRARLAWFVLRCQAPGGHGRLDDIALERWARRQCGDVTWSRFWRPLLDSRFEGHPEGLPATYLWARTRRMSRARSGVRKGERFGMLRGGHQRLAEAMIASARTMGAEIVLGCQVDAVLIGRDGGVDGVRAGGERLPFDLTIATIPPVAVRKLLPSNVAERLVGYPSRSLGVVCVVATTSRSVSPFYSINICDSTPITTLVETSHVSGTEHTGGDRLIYIPRYCSSESSVHTDSDETIVERFTDHVSRMFPHFSRDQLVHWSVQRARFVEPVHAIGAGRRLPPVWGVLPRLGLASSAQIYPWLLNGEAAMRMAENVEQSVADWAGLGLVQRGAPLSTDRNAH